MLLTFVHDGWRGFLSLNCGLGSSKLYLSSFSTVFFTFRTYSYPVMTLFYLLDIYLFSPSTECSIDKIILTHRPVVTTNPFFSIHMKL